MSRARIIGVLTLCAIAIFGCAAKAPAPPPAAPPPPVLNLCALPDAPPKDIAAKPGYVQYAVTVIDKDGKPVTGLKQSDFTVSGDSGPIPISYFHDDKDSMPASLAIIVDTSGSMQSKLVSNNKSRLDTVRDGIRGVLTNMNACDEVTVIVFAQVDSVDSSIAAYPGTLHANTKVEVIEPLSIDHTAALKKLYTIVPYGQTPLFDSVDLAEHSLLDAHYPDGAILVITDGFDNSSTIQQDDLEREVATDQVPLYLIGIGNEHGDSATYSIGPGLPSSGGDALNLEPLQALAARSPGHVWLVSPIDKDAGETLVTALSIVAHSLGHAYSIGFIEPSGSAPRIEVTTRTQTFLRAHRETLAVN